MNAIRSARVAIIDYEMGNLFSVKNACNYIGLSPVITSEASVILSSDAIIFPGVGSFGDAMDNLKRLDLISPIKDFVATGSPFMGICLGLQLLFSESEEFGIHRGLGIIEGSVVKFSAGKGKGPAIKIPHIGWNQIFRPDGSSFCWDKSPLKNLKEGEFMYFVHSYYAKPVSQDTVLSATVYEDTHFCSSLMRKNVFACQFHPEKSAMEGLKIYKNWAGMINVKK